MLRRITLSNAKNKSITQNKSEPALTSSDFAELLTQQVRQAVRTVLENVMQAELSDFLAAAWRERTPDRQGQRNGYYERDLNTKVGKLAGLRVPRDRAGQFQTQVFERYKSSDQAVTQAIAEMFFSGVSQAKVAGITEPLLGVKPSPSTVSRVAHDLDSECAAWRSRPLQAHYRVIYLVAVYFPVVHEGQRDQTPLLVALGIDLQGGKEALACQFGGEESRQNWEELLADLTNRGVCEVDLVITDGNSGLIGAVGQAFPKACRQRCILHKMRNTLAHFPARKKKEAGEALSGIFNQKTAELARQQLAAFRLRYEVDYPGAIVRLEEDVEASLAYYSFPEAMRLHIRTTNALESLFSTVRRRTNPMGVFQNEQSLLLMFWAVIKSTKLKRIPVA